MRQAFSRKCQWSAPNGCGHRLTRRGKRRSAACGGYSKPLSRQRPVWRIRMCPPDGWRNEGKKLVLLPLGKPLKRRRWRMKRGGFKKVP